MLRFISTVFIYVLSLVYSVMHVCTSLLGEFLQLVMNDLEEVHHCREVLANFVKTVPESNNEQDKDRAWVADATKLLDGGLTYDEIMVFLDGVWDYRPVFYQQEGSS